MDEIQKNTAEEIEMFILEKVTKYEIYIPTLYEAADMFDEVLDEDHVEDLFNVYLTATVQKRYTDEFITINGLVPSQVYKYYRGK